MPFPTKSYGGRPSYSIQIHTPLSPSSTATTAATDGAGMADQTEGLLRQELLQEDFTAQNSKEAGLLSGNDDDTSVDSHEEAAVTIQKICKFHFPPLDPENQSWGDWNHAEAAAASI